MKLHTLALLATATLLGGCLNCTYEGCSGGAVVELAPSTPLQAGSYELIIEGDSGFADTCAFRISEDVVECGETTPPCLVDIDCDEISSTRGDDLSVEPSIWFDTTDAELTITLMLDGTELHAVVVNPSYETFSPNGEQCGPTCTATSIEMQIN